MLFASRVARGVAVGAAAIAYAVLAHLSNSTPGAEALGAVLSAGPVWVAAVILAFRSHHRLPALGACALVAALTFYFWRNLEAHFAWLYLVQQAGTYAVLAVSFGRTLARGRTPLCSRLAALVHGPLAPAVADYTRSVTIAWTWFFSIIALVLVVLFVTAPLAIWSAFANFGTVPLIGLMFAAEYGIRRRVLPHMQHHGILATFRAISAGTLREPVAAAAPRA